MRAARAAGIAVLTVLAVTAGGVGAQQPAAEWQRKHAFGLTHRTAWDLYLALKDAARGGRQNPPFSQLPDWTGLWTAAGGGTFVGPGPAGVSPKLTPQADAAFKIRRSDFAPGTKVRITGHPMKDGRPAAAWTRGVRLADGTEFYPRGRGQVE